MHGGRVSLQIGLISMFAVTIIGSAVGAISGYAGGIVDDFLMRVNDFVLTIPFMVFIIVLNSIMQGYNMTTGVWSLIIVFSLLGWGSVSLQIGLFSMFAVTIIGSAVGAISGYAGGIVDDFLMRVNDFVLTIPFMVFIIVLNSIMQGYNMTTGVWSLIIVFSLLGWGSV